MRFARKRHRAADDICISSKKQARNAGLFDLRAAFRLAGCENRGSAPMAMMPIVTMMVMGPPMMAMMAIGPPVVVVMMMRPPVTVMVMMMTPLHVGRQLAGLALRGGGDARTDGSCRLRLLRGSRDDQKRTEGGES
jgi:hypothetical protein